MTTRITDDSVSTDVTSIDDTDSPYTTTGEDIVLVDTSGGAVTVTLNSSDATADPEQSIRIIDDGGDAGTNAITVNTEGSETIDPGGASSKTISVDTAQLVLYSNGTNWIAANRNIESESVTTEDLVDGAGISHTGQLPDLSELFLSAYEKTVGGGSITNNAGSVEVREPGNAGATSESRLYSHILRFDPSVGRTIRINLSNITVDNNLNARMQLGITDAPDTGFNFSGDYARGSIRGNGDVFASVADDGSNSSGSDTTQNNTWVNALNYIEISWDGSTLTVEASDGSTTITASQSTGYPTGEDLFLVIRAIDNDGSNGRNVDFDIDSVVIDA